MILTLHLAVRENDPTTEVFVKVKVDEMMLHQSRGTWIRHIVTPMVQDIIHRGRKHLVEVNALGANGRLHG
jgi:hypothetical protein